MERPDMPTNDLAWLLKLVLFHHGRTSQSDEPPNISKLPHFFSELREYFDRYQNGNQLALLDALRLCTERELPIPNWIDDGLRAFVIQSVKGKAHGERGRSKSPLARTVEALKRWKREVVFRGIRNAQSTDLPDLIRLLAVPSETAKLMNTGQINGLGSTREDAIRLTELSLRGTFAQASFGTLNKMMTEYCETESDYLISHDLQVDLGLADDEVPVIAKDFFEVDAILHVVSLDQIPLPPEEAT